MTKIFNDWQSECYCFTGLSQLSVLYDLYGFDVLFDTPIDLMHNLPMNPVKKHLRHLLDSGNIDRDLIESRLKFSLDSRNEGFSVP